MLIYIATEVDDSDVETSLDFFLAFNEIQVLLLTWFEYLSVNGKEETTCLQMIVCATWPEFCMRRMS